MIQIIVNNTNVDVNESVDVPLNFQASKADDIGEYLSNYSNTFDLPATDNNLALLNNANMVASNSRVPYKALSARLLINGRDLFGVSKLIILEVNDRAIRAAFLGGNQGSALSGSIQSLDLSALNFVFNAANAAARAAATSGVVWAPVNYGVSLLPTTVDINYCYFGVYTRTIFQQIFKEAGLSIVIKNPPNNFFERTILMVTEPKAELGTSKDFLARRSADYTVAGPADVAILFDVVVSGNLAGSYNPATGIFTSVLPAKISSSTRVKLFSPTNGATVTVSIYDSNSGLGSGNQTFTFNGVNDIDVSISFVDINFPANALIRVRLQSTAAQTTIRASSSRFSVEVSDDLVEGETISVAKSLPDISRLDLFADVSKMTNLITTTKDGVTTVMGFDRLDQSEKTDWSGKLDMNKPQAILFQSSFGQSTFFRYSNDSFSPSQTSGDAVVKFDNDALKPTAEALKLLFAGAVDVIFCGVQSISVPANKLNYAEGSGTCGRNGGSGSTSISFSGAHGLRVGNYFSVDDIGVVYYVVAVTGTNTVTVNATVSNFSGSPWTKITPGRNGLTPRLAFTDDNTVVVAPVTYRGQTGTATVTTVKRVMFVGDGNEGLGWDKLLKRNFLLWLGAVERYQMIRSSFKLNDDDVYQYDFTRSVYVRAYGTDFYVQAINKYIGPEDSTEAELFALAEAIDISKITAL